MNRAILIKAEKWAIWAGLIGIIYLLRHLFPIFFLTFVLAYIANTAVKAISARIPSRKVSVILVYVVMLTVLTGVGVLVVPRMITEARNLARIYITTEAAREDAAAGDTAAQGVGIVEREARELIDAFIISVAGHDAFYSFRESEAYAVIFTRLHDSLSRATPRVVQGVTRFANAAFVFILQFGISIILSFLMIWNLPATKARMQQFAYGRTAEIYAEIAPGLRSFGVMLGRAFEAQTVVAIVNALLSSLAFVALGLPSIALLAMIVFFCSYIPILGMILSTAPAALLAFKLGGFPRVIWLVVAILVIHAVEAYLLNPLIYGRHLRLHPLAVLVILLVAEEVIGVWGLILGVPVAAFLLKYGIEGEDVERPKPKVEEEPVPAA
ncbi:MAG TPA: AI-2E family transporter, partial [Thermoanaerobaculia bacterium]|nr:AI-2E family transporter [Thermoanaerobaculia bacterium]